MRSAAKYIWIFLTIAFVGGFLLVETSGLLGRTPLTATTPVATVNGREILYTDWYQRVQRQIESEQQRAGRSLTQDEVRQIEDGVLDQMVMDILLQQEYRRRGITVSDDELREFARYAPPDWLRQSPELQTEGRFDPDKCRRLLASPLARQQGLLAGLEEYYRSEIPRQKLWDQLATGLFVTDADGGDLGRCTRGRFVPDFERAAYALQPGELSQPVLTPYGYHIIRVDERKGDTLAAHHILLRIQPSDSSPVRIDREAAQLASLAAGSTDPTKRGS